MYGKKSGAARSKLVLPPSPPASPTTSPSSALNAVYSVTSKPPKPQPETYLPNITPAATKPEAVKRKNSGAITSFFAQNAQMRKKLKSAATTATTATTTSSTTSSTSSSVSTPPLNAPNKTQYYLDFGQKSFDKSIVCATCQFRYLPSDVGEVKTHKSLCAEFTKGVQFLPPANTTVCRPTIPVPDNTKTSVGLTVVSASIPKGVAVYYIPPSLKFPTVHAKLSSVKKIIDLQMGFCEDSSKDKHTFVCIDTTSGRCVGYLNVELLSTAFVLSNSDEVMNNDYIPLRTHTSVPCVLGVHQIWTHHDHRGRGVGTALLDVAREKMVFGCLVKKWDIAFSSPTGDGARLLKKYVGGEGDVKVYDC